MLGYVGSRLAQTVLVLLGVVTVAFGITNLVPADPARLLAGRQASEETVAGIRAQLGLDRPLYVQYGRYVGALARGDLGRSYQQRTDVRTLLLSRLPATLQLTAGGIFLELLFGLPLGIVSIFFLPAVLEGGYAFYRAAVGFDRLNRFNAILEALQLQNTVRNLPQYFFTTNLYAPSREPIAALTALFGVPLGEEDLGPLSNLLIVDLERAALVMAVYALLFGVLLFWSFTRRDIA